MKNMIILLVMVVLSAKLLAAPSPNSYAGVTNDWYCANFSNVYELAQARLSTNANDSVGIYIMYNWSVSFGYASDISNALNRVIAVSDAITSEPFATKYQQILRPNYISYRDNFLPRLTREMVDQERYKSYLPRRIMISSYPLKLLEQSGLWL